MSYLQLEVERLGRDSELNGHTPLLFIGLGLDHLEFRDALRDILNLKVQPK